MDFDHVHGLRHHHPAWLLLAAGSAPLVIGFLHRCFIDSNIRTASEQDLIVQLDDYLFHVREKLGENAFPKAAADYLQDWTSDDRGWLRRYFPEGSDEPHFDLTPAAERAIRWVVSLQESRFVGAESRLKLVFDLLREIAQGSESDPDVRIAELEQRRDAIEREIEDIRDGRIVFMDGTHLRERFHQAVDTARELLADFRQLEQNFRDLDRQARERIATWDGSKGEVLQDILETRDTIAQSDQGRSFQAFWDFLMAPERQQELADLMQRIFELEEITEMEPDPRLRRIHYDWLTAGEVTQRTIARLSGQLRRFLDDQVLLENRRIMNLLRTIETRALQIRDDMPTGTFMNIDEPAPTIVLPMERPLFRPPVKPRIADEPVLEGDENISVATLFEQTYVDKDRLRNNLRRVLHERHQVGLDELLELHPLEQGLAELVAWFSLATDERLGVVDEQSRVTVTWTDEDNRVRKAEAPAVIFVRDGGMDR